LDGLISKTSGRRKMSDLCLKTTDEISLHEIRSGITITA
jgi:hypothetical protein